MRVAERTKERLTGELEALRLRIAELERAETERKGVDEALRKIEQGKLTILNSMTEHVVYQDAEHRILWVNKAAAESVNLSTEQLVGRRCYEVWPKRNKPCVGCPVAKARKTGKPQEAEITTPDGRVWFIRGYPIRNANDQLVGAVEVTLEISERKETEKALQTEKNKLQSVIDAMEYGLTIQDKDYNIIYQNELVKTIFGDRLGEKCYQVYESQEKLCDGCPVKKAFRDGKSHTSERRVVLPSGEVTFWENTANPIRDAEGEIVSCLEINRNITERKRAEEALQKSQEELRKMLESVTDGISVIDLNGVITEVNQRTVEMHGFSSRDELLGKNALGLIAPRDHERVKTNMRKALKEGTIKGVEYTLLRADGSEFPGELSTSVLRDTAGNLVGHITIARDITGRKEAEKALLESEERFRSIVENSQAGIMILDDAYRCIYMNPELCRMSGYSRNELIGQDFRQFLDEESQQLVADRYIRRQRGEEVPPRYEFNIVRKDSQKRRVEISSAVLKDSAGKVKTVVQILDITERKQAEDAVREAEEKYKNFVEATSDLVWEADGMGTYTFVSPRIEDILGYEADEVVGKKRTLDFAPEEEKRKWLSRFKEVNAKRVPFFGFEITHIHKNGSPVVFEVSGAPFSDSAGNFKGFVGINKDVTERKQAEEALRESQKFSSGLLENSPNPIFVVNPDTSVKYVNPAFEKLTGFTLAEITGREAPYPWWPKEQWKETAASFKNAMVTGGRRSEKVFQKENGERFFVALNSAPIVHEGKLLYFLINWLDITERKRAEGERSDLEQKAHLASRLASVGEMASGIAHEINNPLTAVIGFAQLLMDTDLPDEVKEDIGVIHREAQRAAGVARNLLTFARKHTPTKQPTNLNAIIEGVLKLRAYEQSVSNIKVNTRLALDLPEVMADYSQMQQVFINIILNAESAMLESGNGGTLTVTTQKVNNTVRASFADSGPGIAKENLNRIFDPFFTTKEVGKGTGLGLSVCHGIVAEHGGRIYARSRLGNGATFIVELPVNAH